MPSISVRTSASATTPRVRPSNTKRSASSMCASYCWRTKDCTRGVPGSRAHRTCRRANSGQTRPNMRLWRMDLSASREPDPPPISSRRDRAGGIVATATVLALLYFGRDVLVPVTLAVILSLLIAPLVRALRSVGMGQTLSVLAAVLGLAVAVGAAAAVIGVQVVKMTASLPQYEQTIRYKLTKIGRA